MKTLKESIADYNVGKLNIRDRAYTVLDLKSALLTVYRSHGFREAQDILSYFKVSTVEELRESQFDLFFDMCGGKEVKSS